MRVDARLARTKLTLMHYKRVGQLAERLPTIPSQKKAHHYSRCRCRLGREIVRISLIIRNLGFTNFECKRLIGRVNNTMEIMRPLDRQVSNLERRLRARAAKNSRKITASRSGSIAPT